jgi:hypothetical protein
VGWRHFSDAAPAGSTGNNTHAGVAVDGYEDVVTLVLEFITSAIGATPTVSFKWQGALEGPEVSDAASNWFDLDVLPEGTATEAVTQTVTATGAYTSSLEIARRPIRKIRLVTSANTNVTYGPFQHRQGASDRARHPRKERRPGRRPPVRDPAVNVGGAGHR